MDARNKKWMYWKQEMGGGDRNNGQGVGNIRHGIKNK